MRWLHIYSQSGHDWFNENALQSIHKVDGDMMIVMASGEDLILPDVIACRWIHTEGEPPLAYHGDGLDDHISLSKNPNLNDQLDNL